MVGCAILCMAVDTTHVFNTLGTSRFSTASFIDGLSKRLMCEQLEKAGGGSVGFEASSFIALFKQTLEQLKKVRSVAY